MEDLTFGEQVKIILGRRGMTIKQLAEMIEEKTGKKMSRQNLTQRLGRDNFQEQDMRMIAEILGCPFYLSIMAGEMQTQSYSHREAAAEDAGEIQDTVLQAGGDEEPAESPVEIIRAEEAELQEPVYEEAMPETTGPEAVSDETAEVQAEAEEPAEPEEEPVQAAADVAETEQEAGDAQAELGERDMTIGELYEIHEELTELEENIKAGEDVEEIKKELEKPRKERFRPGGLFLRRKNKENHQELSEDTENTEQAVEETESEEAGEEPAEESRDFEPVITHNDAEEDPVVGEVNPYTGREYQSNSVRMHPTRIGYVQVYDRTIHKWTDMTEWAFLGLQERKKALLGKAYEPPIYLD